MKTFRQISQTRHRRQLFAKRLGKYESLEHRLVMANDFLAGTTFVDTNNNGQFDTNESYLQGATIELRSSDGATLIATRTTDAKGGYLFNNLSAGEYKLVNRSATNYASNSSQILSDISSISGSTVNSINVVLKSPTDLQASVDMDRFTTGIGLFENATITIDGNTIATKVGQLPAKIHGSTLTPNPSAEFLSLSVDLYNGLGAGLNGPYDVNADSSPIGPGSPHNGQRVAYLYNHFGRAQLSASEAAGLQLAIWELLYDASDSDPDGDLTGGKFSASASASAITAAEGYLTASFGKSESAIFLNSPSQPNSPTTNRYQSLIVGGSFNFGNVTAAKIGDLVWHDKNVNGRQEGNEPRIVNATVNLYQNSTLIATTTTNSSGIYQFDHLLAGAYKVEFLLPAGFTRFSAANQAIDSEDSDGPVTDTITLTAGETNNTVDQGFYNLAKLGDFVWNDRNGNGFQTPDEEGISNARVNLLQNNTVVDTTVTDSTGRYFFNNVMPGVYDVEFIQPDGFAYVSPQGQENSAFDSDGPLALQVNLESGEVEDKIDQGYYGAATIGNFVWHDVDGDGVQDNGEVGINDVTVSLLQDGIEVDTTHTTAGGLYSFIVAPGTYTLKFTQPSNYSGVSPKDATSDDLDSDGLSTAPITVVSDGVYNNIDQGFYNLAKIGDYVWHDVDADGIQDNNESGIDGVTVRLLKDSQEVASTLTAGGGRYSFNVAPGTYTVNFVMPADYTNVSPSNATSDDSDSDGLTTAPVTVVSGEVNNTLDQGFFKLVKIGNFVWNDLDADGIQDADEPGIEGVNVTLLQGTTEIASTITGVGGFYTFGVIPGTYSVQFKLPPGYGKVSPTDATNDDQDSDDLNTAPLAVRSGETNNSFDLGLYNLAKIGNFVWDDLNADGIQDAGEPGIEGVSVELLKDGSQVATGVTGVGGLYSFSVTPGTYSVRFTKPSGYSNVTLTDATSDNLDSDGLTPAAVTVASGETNNSIDLGLYNLAKLGNFVWDDLDADGVQDAGEPGIEGVSVELLKAGSLVTTATTGTGGLYSFNVTPGTYSVRFIKPAGYSNVTLTDATGDDLDSDGLTPAAVTVVSGATNNSIDLGLYNLAKLGNFVWDDLDADGIQDAGEPGIEGVSVELLKSGSLVTTTTTSAGGLYSFNVTPGIYSVRFIKPAGYSNVTLTDATSDDLDSDGLTPAAVTVVSGETNNSIDLGLYNLAKLGNFVWDDLDADGVQDAGEPGIEGVSVELLKAGSLVTTVTTGAGGLYSFNVTPGTYTVRFTKPAGYSNVTLTDATSDDLDSDGLTPGAVTVVSGETNNSIDLGLYNLAKLGNFVWNDLDADGIQDVGEPGIDGVTVTLMQGGTQVTTTTTAGGGLYSFSVVPGTYSVKFTQPAGFTNISPSDATNDDLDSDGLTPGAVTVVSGQTNNSVDVGFYNSATNVCIAIDLQGNTATSGAYGNVRTFSAGGVTVNASAFSRTSAGAWSAAYLGSYGGGLGVTDSSETGDSTTHTVDNTGRLNYVLFEFSQPVLVDSAFLGYVVGDSDLTAWIGNVGNAFTNHQSLSNAFLSGLGFSEVNLTTLTTSRTADLNAGGLVGNILVIAAQVDDTSPEDYFKIANLTVCVPAGPANASIGDFVWHDVNGNGLQDSGEAGIAGATVTLTGGGADKAINGVGDTTTTLTTDSSGKYSFANLSPGTQYKVTFSLPSGYDAATARKIGANSGLDSDGLTSDVVVLGNAESNTSIDAGFIKYVKIGNYVWNDLDKDGLQEAGEPGIAGVQVSLTGTSASGAAVSQSTTTAAGGAYQFSTLQPGTYNVSIASSNFNAGGVLVGYTASPTLVGTDRGLDSNVQSSSTTPAALASAGSDQSIDFGYYVSTALACVTMKMEGNTSTSGTAGNIRTFTAGGISVKASAFARDSWGAWTNAYLGSFPGGLGVTDTSEGSGSGSLHTVDNVGRRNYILFEFSQTVTIDSAFLGYVVTDSDLTAWIGNTNNAYNNHGSLSDSYLNALGYLEANDTTLGTTRTADLNAGNRTGNIFVIAASTTGTQNDWFKVAELSLCGTVPASSAGTKFFVVDDAVDKTFKYTSAVQFTSNFAVTPTSPTGIAANPAGTNTWVSESGGKIFKYDNNGVIHSSWSTSVSSTQGVSTNGTSIWTVSNSTDRVYFYSGAASFVPTTSKLNPTLSSSFRLHTSNTNPKDLATDGNTVWVVDDGAVDFVYAYSVSGSYLGRWQLDSNNSAPTGITIDPTGGSKIWIVDAGKDKIFEYSGATGCRSGGLIAAKSYALNTGAGNTNPQGIADPPSIDAEETNSEALTASQLVDGSFVNPEVNPYYNVLSATDVNDDGLTTAMDALVIINRLNSAVDGKLSIDAVSNGERLDLTDVNNDGSVSPIDALLVINRLNQGAVDTRADTQSSSQSINDTTGAADTVFGDLGSGAEGEMSAAAFLFDTELTLKRRK